MCDLIIDDANKWTVVRAKLIISFNKRIMFCFGLKS